MAMESEPVAGEIPSVAQRRMKTTDSTRRSPAAGPPRAERTAATTGCPEEPNRWVIGLFRVSVDTDNENRKSVAFPAAARDEPLDL